MVVLKCPPHVPLLSTLFPVFHFILLVDELQTASNALGNRSGVEDTQAVNRPARSVACGPLPRITNIYRRMAYVKPPLAFAPPFDNFSVRVAGTDLMASRKAASGISARTLMPARIKSFFLTDTPSMLPRCFS